jgi:hypothetical protein
MSEVFLDLGSEILQVDQLLLSQVSSLFASPTAPVRYKVTSAVPPSIVRTFAAAITGKPLSITPATLAPLSAVCQELCCPRFLEQLAAFQNSAEYGISSLTARVNTLEAEIVPLRTDVSGLKSCFSLGLDSAILCATSSCCPGFAALFAEFRGRRFTLLWRGSRDGFGGRDFHHRCDGHANTLTLVQDTRGNIFGGFTPVEWESLDWKNPYNFARPTARADVSLKSCLFTLKNPHSLQPRRFALRDEGKSSAIYCSPSLGPHFCDIAVWDNCNANARSYASAFGQRYNNDTELDGGTFFTKVP